MHDKQLEYFVALYKSGSITETASDLFLTRQALSLSIRQLERELGAELFKRTKHGVKPTKAAELLFAYTSKHRTLWEKTMREIREAQPEQRIRIALHVMYFTAEQIQQFLNFQNEPRGAVIELYNIADSGQCQSMLEEGKADLGITHKPPNTARLTWEKLFDADAWLLMRADNRLATQEMVDFGADMGGQSVAFVSLETLREVEPLLLAQGASCIFLSSDRVLLQQSIHLNNNVMLIPSHSISNFLSKDMLAKKVLNFPVTNGRYLIYEKKSLPQLQAFMQYYRQIVLRAEPVPGT